MLGCFFGVYFSYVYIITYFIINTIASRFSGWNCEFLSYRSRGIFTPAVAEEDAFSLVSTCTEPVDSMSDPTETEIEDDAGEGTPTDEPADDTDD